MLDSNDKEKSKQDLFEIGSDGNEDRVGYNVVVQDGVGKDCIDGDSNEDANKS